MYDDNITDYSIHQAMFLCNSATPVALKFAFEWFRFTQTFERVTRYLNQQINSVSILSVTFLSRLRHLLYSSKQSKVNWILRGIGYFLIKSLNSSTVNVTTSPRSYCAIDSSNFVKYSSGVSLYDVGCGFVRTLITTSVSSPLPLSNSLIFSMILGVSSFIGIVN